jgi:hypothetical protein
LLGLLFITSTAYAGDLRILDPNGLIRVTKRISQPVTVKLFLQQGSSTEMKLVSSSGVSIATARVEGGVVYFEGVGDGEWQVKNSGSSVQVRKVEVVE